MIKIRLAKSPLSFLIFDGTVLEYFSEQNDAGKRYHAGLIESIEVTSEPGGACYLKMNTSRVSLRQELDADVVNEVRALIAQVQEAMES